MKFEVSPVQPAHSGPLSRELQFAQGPAAAPRVDPARLLDPLRANARLVLTIAATVTLLGVAWAFTSTPIYRATALVQVEEAEALPRGLSPNEAPLRSFDPRTVGAPELEVLRSRMVFSSAVDKVGTFIEAQPKRFPLIGAWLARSFPAFELAGPMARGGFVWGAARLEVERFDVPASLEGLRFQLRRTTAGYSLARVDGSTIAEGQIGEPLTLQTGQGPIELMLNAFEGDVGDEWSLVRQPRLLAVENLQRDVEIGEKGRQSGVIAVSLEDTDPLKAAAVVKEIVAQYLHQNEIRRSEGAEKQLAFLNKQVPELKDALEQSEQRYNEARNRLGTVDLGEEARGLLQLSVVQQTKLIELNQKRAEMAARYTDEHPVLRALDQQLSSLRREQNQISGRIKRLPQIEQDVLRLSRDVKVNTEVYTNVVNASQQLRLAAASKVGNVRLLDAPETPVKPVKPRKLIVVTSAMALGLLLGLLVALARKALGGRVYSPGEIEDVLGVTVGGIILHSEQPRRLLGPRRSDGKASRSSPSSPYVAPSSAALEGLHRMQSCLLQGEYGEQNLRHPVLLFAGPSPGVGKSFVSCNFAMVMATAGKRVLLIDADLRHGALHRQFGLERGKGFSEAILAAAEGDSSNDGEDLCDRNGRDSGFVHRSVAPNLDFLSTGELPSMPAMLLANPAVGPLLRRLAVHYDLVILDTAPVLAVADTLMLAPHADLTFNVVRAGVTTLSEIEETERQLRRAGARPGEVIYNDMKSRQARYGYHSGYGQVA